MNEIKKGKQIWQTFVDFLMLSCLLFAVDVDIDDDVDVNISVEIERCMVHIFEDMHEANLIKKLIWLI